MDTTNKQHWETVYETKSPAEVSWTQEVPQTSLDFIHALHLDKSARIIDIGGGDSRLADFLLEEGFENITVLDISAKALEKAKQRLGDKADKIRWIVSDITGFEPDTTYEIWHDRATFHFLTRPEQVSRYINIARKAVNGHLILATFSEQGPQKCSGLPIRQYSETSLTATLEAYFEKMQCHTENHTTPFNTTQHFLFCMFRRR